MSALKSFNSTNYQIRIWASQAQTNLLESYGKKSDPLDALLQESSTIIPKDLSTEKASNRAIENLTNLFEKLSFGTTEAQKVEEVKNVIFDKVIRSDISKLSLYDLFERVNAQRAVITDSVEDYYIDQKIIEIQSRSDAKGIFYKITNEFGVTSFMIGTIHRVPQKTVHLNGRVSEILSKGVKELILEHEVTEHAVVNFMRAKIGDEEGFNASCDVHLYEVAREKGVEISFLEPFEFMFEQIVEDMKSRDNPDYSKEQKDLIIRHRGLSNYEIIEAFQRGNFEELASRFRSYMPNSTLESAAKRNRRWVSGDPSLCTKNQDGLLKRLKETKVPLAIGVGVGHIFFQEGLSKLLKNGGLRVERDS